MMSIDLCDVCGRLLQRQYCVDYWGNKFCPEHQSAYEVCFSCSRLTAPRLTGGSVQYSHQITICNLCRRSEVVDDKRFYGLFREVKTYLAQLGLDLRRIPIFLRLVPITAVSLATYSKRWTGLTQKTVFSSNGQVTAQRIDEIKILRGLPAEQTQSILAHEAGHAWLGLSSFPSLHPFVEEGLCELIDYLWLSARNTSDAQYRIYLKFNNPDPIYGAGFRAAYAALSGHPLTELLNYVKNHQQYPKR